MPQFPDEIEYSAKYFDDTYEYRHVLLNEITFAKLPKSKLLNEEEWRAIGVQQSRGWEHYMIFKPEPWILLFRKMLAHESVASGVIKKAGLCNTM